ncbi:hypothetical protein HRbin12_01306 [bacterium HR12]|nr:hypothetical protein HRbin12_01306 [bacterium HR12]
MTAAGLDWSMGSRAEVLVDWRTAAETGRRLAGAGPPTTAEERERLRADLAELVPRAEALVAAFTGLTLDGSRSRPWVMSRGTWVEANLGGLRRLLEPLARRLVPEGASRSPLRRKALGAQIGGLLGYVSRKVLGQYDAFLPPDDEGLVYFVGPNLIETERRFGLPSRDFRLWIALHEVTHRLQFGATPWLRGYLKGRIDEYLATVQVDPRELLEQLRRAVEELRRGVPPGVHGIMLLLTPEQRELFRSMQALMSLLEGHASWVMNEVGRAEIRDVARLRRSLRRRREAGGAERALQRAIGFDQKVRQYDVGEAFVRRVAEALGRDGLRRVFERPEHLPTLEEIGRPERWISRVVGP